jgi:hypothetical protein
VASRIAYLIFIAAMAFRLGRETQAQTIDIQLLSRGHGLFVSM